MVLNTKPDSPITMAVRDTVRLFEERRFLELTREDAISLADWIDGETGAKAGHVLHKTDASVDQSVVAKHPWFLPYVLATEYVDILPFSSETAKYLVNHPVVPGDEFLAGVDKEGDGLVSPEAPVSGVNDEAEKQQEVTKTPKEKPASVKFAPPPPPEEPPVRRRSAKQAAPAPDAVDETKYQKIAQCFVITMECVAKCTTSIPDYFDSVVLSHIFHKNEAAKKVLTDRKPGSMDESLFALAALDDGNTLRTIGIEMVTTVVRVAKGKYGTRAVDSIVKQSIRPSGAKTLTDAYTRSFPRYPATLDMMLKTLKAGIMDLKK